MVVIRHDLDVYIAECEGLSAGITSFLVCCDLGGVRRVTEPFSPADNTNTTSVVNTTLSFDKTDGRELRFALKDAQAKKGSRTFAQTAINLIEYSKQSEPLYLTLELDAVAPATNTPTVRIKLQFFKPGTKPASLTHVWDPPPSPEQLIQEREKLKQTLDGAKKEIEAREQALKEEKQREEELEQKLAKMDAQTRPLRATLSQAELKIAQQTRELELADQNYQELMTSQQHIADLTREKDDLKSRLESVQNSILDTKGQDLDEQLAEAQSTIAELKAQLAESTKRLEEVDGMKSKVNAVVAERNQFKAQLADATGFVTERHDSLDAMLKVIRFVC
eukprot:c4870_g1_i1.p1 GENE.c4870_g1_i1~~c4870_g1_i1.p1  ORF type:complete len:335 (-),score=80.78 c4870_g1_i1:449-1453(-)